MSESSTYLPTQAIKDRLIELVRPRADHYAASDLDREVLAWLEGVPTDEGNLNER